MKNSKLYSFLVVLTVLLAGCMTDSPRSIRETDINGLKNEKSINIKGNNVVLGEVDENNGKVYYEVVRSTSTTEIAYYNQLDNWLLARAVPKSFEVEKKYKNGKAGLEGIYVKKAGSNEFVPIEETPYGYSTLKTSVTEDAFEVQLFSDKADYIVKKGQGNVEYGDNWRMINVRNGYFFGDRGFTYNYTALYVGGTVTFAYLVKHRQK